MLPTDVASLFCGQGEHGSFPALDLYVSSGQAIQKNIWRRELDMYIPYGRKFSRDPIFAEGPSSEISRSNFRGWMF